MQIYIVKFYITTHPSNKIIHQCFSNKQMAEEVCYKYNKQYIGTKFLIEEHTLIMD